MQLRRKRFERPDETRPFDHGRIELVRLGELVIGRAVFEPGWRWSEHLRQLTGTESCQNHHVGYVASGELHVEMDDGASIRLREGDVFEVPPGHDAWVVGDEPWVSIDYAGRRTFALGASVTSSGRVFSTVVFTDLSGSTQALHRLGDVRWASLLAEHNDAVRREIERFAGREVTTTGDGFLVIFDTPSRAIEGAMAMVAAARRFELTSRAGVHTGEIELVGEDVRGIAVHASARILALARPDEVLVSETVRDLLAGSGFSFEDRGEHELRGIEGRRRLYAATAR